MAGVPAAFGAGPGQYGVPEWLPLRHDANGGGITVGCTNASPDGLCAGHHGYWAIDFIGSTGSPIYAAGAGFASNVTGAGFEGYGNTVVVDHGAHGKSLYAHLSTVLVGGGGRWVDQNDEIGRMGSSGGADTPHLHYEESSNGKFGSAGGRDPGSMKTCKGAQLVTLPDAWGYSGWAGLRWGSGTAESDGTACAVVGVVAGAIGANVGNAVPAATAVAAPASEDVVAADFNGDGVGDVGFRNSATGLFTFRFGPTFSNQTTYSWATGTNYQPFAADFNADRVADLGLRDGNSGTVYIKHGPAYADQLTYTWTPGPNMQVVAADFNADTKADIGLRDSATGVFSLRNGPAFEGVRTYQSAAGTEYQAVAADFNGDRMADIGLRHTGTGLIAVNLAPTFAGQLTHQWAQGPGYQVFATDFNGDGVADLGLKNGSIPVLDIRHGPSFANQISAPLDPRLQGLAALLGSLFASLAARTF